MKSNFVGLLQAWSGSHIIMMPFVTLVCIQLQGRQLTFPVLEKHVLGVSRFAFKLWMVASV